MSLPLASILSVPANRLPKSPMAPFPKGTGLYRCVIPLAPCTRMPPLLTCIPPLDNLRAPWRLALVTIMPCAENLTDRQAADAVRRRIDWQYALGLDLADAGCDVSVLREFRVRLPAGEAVERSSPRCLGCLSSGVCCAPGAHSVLMQPTYRSGCAGPQPLGTCRGNAPSCQMSWPKRRRHGCVRR